MQYQGITLKAHSNTIIYRPCPTAVENFNRAFPSPQTGSPTTWRHSTNHMPAATCFSHPSSRAGFFCASASLSVKAKFRAPPSAYKCRHERSANRPSSLKSSIIFSSFPDGLHSLDAPFSLSLAPTWACSPTNPRNRELKQITATTATRTFPNKRFNEQNDSCAHAL